MADREENVYKAKLAEQAERYDEMVEEMKKVAKQDQEQLTIEERNLLSVAYKNVIGARRASWRIVSSIEQKEKDKATKDDSKKSGLMKQYKEKIEKELTTICDEVIDLLEHHLIPSAAEKEPLVFYRKMMGDYYRYKAEIAASDDKEQIAEKSLNMYEKALVTSQELPSTHPIRLGLALNFSVFYYEIMNSPSNACKLAKEAFDNAIRDIESVDDANYKDSTLILQLLRDNLTLWTSDDATQEVQDLEKDD